MELCCFEGCDQEGEILFIKHDQYFCKYHAVDSIENELTSHELSVLNYYLSKRLKNLYGP